MHWAAFSATLYKTQRKISSLIFLQFNNLHLHDTMKPAHAPLQKWPFLRGIWTTSNARYLGTIWVCHQMASLSVQPYLHSSPHTNTDHVTCDRCSKEPRVCTICIWRERKYQKTVHFWQVCVQLPTSADNVTLFIFAAKCQPCSSRLISPGRRAHSSKPARVVCEWMDGQTDRHMDA